MVTLKDYIINKSSLEPSYFAKYNHTNLKDYDEVLSKIIDNNIQVIMYMDEEAERNSAHALQATKKVGIAFTHFHPDAITKEIAITAVKENGEFLSYLPDNFRASVKVVKEAVVNSPLSLQHARYPANDNEDILMSAVKKDPQSLKYASNRLKGDLSLVYEAVKKNEGLIHFAGDNLKYLCNNTKYTPKQSIALAVKYKKEGHPIIDGKNIVEIESTIELMKDLKSGLRINPETNIRKTINKL